MRITIPLLTILFATPVVAVAQTAAGDSVDPRWQAWLGCWQQLEETVKTENLVDPGTSDALPVRGVSVCVTPAATPSAVILTTTVEKQTRVEETVVADGAPHAMDQPGCRGTQRAAWSTNGLRVYARAELECEDGSRRAISGVTTIVPGPVWVDIQVVEAEGRESIRVRRYRRSPDQSLVASRVTEAQLAAASERAARQARSFGMEDVKEASARVTASAVEAALIESNARFPLNAKRLEELDAAGVPDRVMDLMIALTFPHKFVVERRAASPGGSDPGLWWFDSGYDIFPYSYAPFGYGMWGHYDYYAYGPVYVVESGGDVEPQPSGQGRVVDGMGYTRVRARAPARVESGGSAVDSSGADATTSSTGSSSGGVSSQGYSGGGGDSGRTAVPRPPQQ